MLKIYWANGSVNKLLSLSNTFTSQKFASDRLTLNIRPTSVLDGLISSFPSFPINNNKSIY